jgi:hypothetical protein
MYASLLDQLGGGVSKLADNRQGELLHPASQLWFGRSSVRVKQVSEKGTVASLLIALVRSVAIRRRRGSIGGGWGSVFRSRGSITAGTSVICGREEKEEEREEKEEETSCDQGRQQVDRDVAVGEELPGHVEHLCLHTFVPSELKEWRYKRLC